MSISHRLSKTHLYKVYHSMKGRCYNPSNPSYKNYGERGIFIWYEWLVDFTEFYNWAISNGYERGLEIDRIDVNGNYTPSNCRWVTRIINARNTRSNISIHYNEETRCLSDWCQILNLNYSTIYARIVTNGWSVEEAFSMPTKAAYRELNINKKANATVKSVN